MTAGSSTPSRRFSARNGIVFLATFVLSCVLLAQFLPFPEVAMVGGKVRYLARHGDDYDVLFLGSSHVEMQIIPAIFDRVAGANGVPVKSFNGGIAAMFSPENGYLLEAMLRCPHRRLRWVFIELSPIAIKAAGEQTSRFAYWHDNARLMLVVRRVCEEFVRTRQQVNEKSNATFTDRWMTWWTTGRQLGEHVWAWLLRGINFGRGCDALNRWAGTPGWKDDVRESVGKEGDGWIGARQEFQVMPEAEQKNYDRAYAARLESPAVKDRNDEVFQAGLERMVNAIVKAGAQPILLVAPAPDARDFYPTVDRERELTILDFSDVRQNAELFLPEHRLDVAHLNTVGAKLFTEDLARRFAALAKKQASPR
jgi:hypothetical protein